jgi:hypothetical protein
MTRDYHVTTFGPRYQWNRSSALIDSTNHLLDPFDLETGFLKESGFVHNSQVSDTQGSSWNHASCHRVVTPNCTHPSTLVRGGLEARREPECLHDPSPTSVQSDLNHFPLTKVVTGAIGFSIPPERRFFPVDTNDALLRTQGGTFAEDLSWDGKHLVDNQSLHDDEILVRLEEGLQILETTRSNKT